MSNTVCEPLADGMAKRENRKAGGKAQDYAGFTG